MVHPLSYLSSSNHIQKGNLQKGIEKLVEKVSGNLLCHAILAISIMLIVDVLAIDVNIFHDAFACSS